MLEDTAIAETMAICRYFEGLKPDPPLFGRDVLDCARVEMWNRRLELHLLLAVSHVFRNAHPAMALRIRELLDVRGLAQGLCLSDTTPSRPSGLDSAPLERLGEYQIVRRITRGGMGEIYEAYHALLRRRVAAARPEILGKCMSLAGRALIRVPATGLRGLDLLGRRTCIRDWRARGHRGPRPGRERHSFERRGQRA